MAPNARVRDEALLSAQTQIQELKDRLSFYNLIFNHIYNGVLVTNADGYITHFNEPYGRFLGVNPAEQIGRHTTEVVENTRMHIVAQTGRPEINVPHRIKGQDMVVQRIPIQKDGKVIAVFGQVMFKNVRDVGKLANQLSLLRSKVRLYEQELNRLSSTRYTLDNVIGQSPAIRTLREEASQAAATELPVLITGESGTGKELFAQAIHHASSRRGRPFVRINCAAIPRDLFESELFGYDKGAFTGASSSGKPGKFELADGGTVFLDEVGELPATMQPKLLRVLEEKEFERVGGTGVRRTDFRLIAATNQNLEERLRGGEFRKDLFYRLNGIPLHIPPLRERREDIAALATHHLRSENDRPGQRFALTAEALRVMMDYAWPGNVRELFTVLQRVVSGLDGEVIHTADLPFFLNKRPPASSEGTSWSLATVLARAEREALRHALASCGGNKTRAAEMLGIHRTLLYRKLKRHEL